jgi:hypothetical protein
MLALLALKRSIVHWPSFVEKTCIKSEIASAHGFPNIVGIMDGTYIPLAYRPSRHGKDYFCRKQFYSLTTLIVFYHYRRIIYIYAGFPGSAHDSRAFVNNKICQLFL